MSEGICPHYKKPPTLFKSPLGYVSAIVKSSLVNAILNMMHSKNCTTLDLNPLPPTALPPELP